MEREMNIKRMVTLSISLVANSLPPADSGSRCVLPSFTVGGRHHDGLDRPYVLFKEPLALRTRIKSATSARREGAKPTYRSSTSPRQGQGEGGIIAWSLPGPKSANSNAYVSERTGPRHEVEFITVSIDTPRAETLADEAKISNMTFLSDYRGGDFGKTYGLFLKGPHILARTVMVVDAQNTVRYLQITPELAQLPDMEEAFSVARTLITSS